MSDYESVEFFQEIANLRGNLGDLLSFDWVPMPIAFMQVYGSLYTVLNQSIIVDNHSGCLYDDASYGIYCTR